MSKGIGRLVSVSINREIQRGTAVGTPMFSIAYAELDIDEKDSRVLDEQAYGVIEGSTGESIVKQWSEATIKAPIGDQHFPLILYSLLGTLTTVTGTATGTPYYHTLVLQQGAQHQSLTLQLDDSLGGQDYVYPLGVVTDLEIAYERGQFINYTTNLKAKKGTAQSVTGTPIAENRFLPQHLTFKYGTARASLTSATAIPLKSAKITMNQNIEDDDVLGNIAPVDFLNKHFTIEGEVEAIWQNESDFKTDSLTGTARAVRFELTNNSTVIGTATGTVSPALRIDLHKVTFEPITKPYRLNDIVMQRLAFKAHYDTTTARMVTVDAVNSKSFY